MDECKPLPMGEMELSNEERETLEREEMVWREIKKIHHDGSIVKGRILNQVNGGYSVGREATLQTQPSLQVHAGAGRGGRNYTKPGDAEDTPLCARCEGTSKRARVFARNPRNKPDQTLCLRVRPSSRESPGGLRSCPTCRSDRTR